MIDKETVLLTLEAAVKTAQTDIDKLILSEALAYIKNQNELIDWAETLLCNAEAPEHCDNKEWALTIRMWRDRKHEKAI